MSKDIAIGIDLGTTNSCAAMVENGKPRVIHSRLGYPTIPSVVTFSAEKVVVGQAAERRLVLAPQETIYGSKRLLGRTFLAGVKKRFQPHFHYQLVADEDHFIGAEISGQTISIVDVSAHILREIKRNAEDRLGHEVTKAVVTVPAYYNDNQRQFVREAGERAGLEVLRTLNEPTAAALCYGMGRGENKTLLVFDLGGGTFDVSIVEVNQDSFTVLGVDGDTFLGGLDFDHRITDWLHDKISEDMGEELELSAVGRERLRLVARDTKHQLSVKDDHEITIPNLVLMDGTKVDVIQHITREMLEDMTSEFLDRTMDLVGKAMDRASVRASEIDEVLLVGGQTRMPAVHQRIREKFDKEPTKRVHPDEVVALGAAIDAHNYSDPTKPKLNDVVPMTIGVANAAGMFMPVVPRNTPVPHEDSIEVAVPANCDSFQIAVFQGDRSHAFDNEFLGSITMDGLDDVPAQKLTVLFILNAEGLLTLKVRSEQGEERQVTLATRLSPEDALVTMGREQIQVTAPSDLGSAARRRAQHTPTAAELEKLRAPALAPPSAQAPSNDPASRYGGSALIQMGGNRPGLFKRIWRYFFG